jgi:DNA-binding IclR family transcriptional regulator
MEPSEPEFPPEFRAFLYSCIDSVEQVEILALLCRSDRSWNARAVGTELGLPDIAARHHLETLSARGLLQTRIANEVTYSYGPKSTDLRRYGDQLSEYYATSRTVLLRFIATSPRRVKRFADAFKLRSPE